MENVGLKIVLEANAQGAVKGIETVNKALNTMPAAANKAGAALGKVGAGAANATPALINFGRVIQDAPFGLIGIANNIDPLISSFQSLKASTGSTGLAFKALAGSLLGPAGIGIAVSAVTSALIAFGPRLFGASKEAKDLDKALTGVASSAAEDLVKLQTYVSFAQDASKATSERQKAVKALKDEYPQYLKNLSEEAILTGAATDAINKSIDAILKRATIKLLQDEIAAVVAETAKQIIAIQKQVALQKQATISDQERAKSVDKVTNAFDKQAFAALQAGRSTSEATSQIGLAADRAFANKPETKIQELKDELVRLVAPLLSISDSFDDFGNVNEKAAKKVKVNKDEINELSRAYRGLLGLLDSSGSLANNRLIIEVATKFEKDQIKKNIEDLVKFVNVLPQPTVKLRMDSNIQAVLDDIKKQQALVQAQMQAFRDIIYNSAQDAAVAFGEGIGNILAGAKNPFAPLIAVLAEGLISLGKQVIATSTLMVALKKALASIGVNPAGGLAIGIALVALGSLLKAKVQQTRFADGGIVTGPTNALIGEAGPEVVFPLDRIREFMGNDRGGMQPVVLTTTVRGSDLLLIQDRAGATYRRTNG